jgi:outer membrane lipoprotein-sorting protein
VINGNSFYLKRGGRAATYDISTNALMGSLAKTLLGCVHGEVEKVAQSNNATVETKETSEGHVVTLTARKVAARGYSKIVLTYRKSDSMLVRMQMDQAGGISTVYVMSDIKTGVDIDPSEFNIPSKQQ